MIFTFFHLFLCFFMLSFLFYYCLLPAFSYYLLLVLICIFSLDFYLFFCIFSHFHFLFLLFIHFPHSFFRHLSFILSGQHYCFYKTKTGVSRLMGTLLKYNDISVLKRPRMANGFDRDNFRSILAFYFVFF